MYTRKDYLDGKCTHRQFYSQFVNANQIKIVVSCIGEKELLEVTPSTLGKIPLEKWEECFILPYLIKKYEEFCTTSPLSSKVCIVKEAAKQYLESKGIKGKWSIVHKGQYFRPLCEFETFKGAAHSIHNPHKILLQGQSEFIPLTPDSLKNAFKVTDEVLIYPESFTLADAAEAVKNGGIYSFALKGK